MSDPGILSRTNDYKTSAEIAYDVIFQKILAGEFKPGTKLSRRKMAEVTGVSVIPVNEALHRLEAEGLVESVPHWGSRVVPLTDEIVRDRFVLREAIECQIARILAGSITDAAGEELMTLAEDLDRSSREPPFEHAYCEKHYAFHTRLAELTGNKSLLQALRRINLFMLLQVALNRRLKRPEKIATDLHRRVVRGILTRNPDEAEQWMRAHVRDSGWLSALDS